MKTIILYLSLLCTVLVYSQIQIGESIIGESQGDNFGEFVSLSSDGRKLAVGAPNSHVNGVFSGYVKVYENISGNWAQLGQDIIGTENSFFGKNTSLSSDGTTLAIGNDPNSNAGPEFVRVYEYISGTWTQIGVSFFSWSGYLGGLGFCLSADGRVIAIGKPSSSTDFSASGQVNVYKNIFGNWTQIGADIFGEAYGDNIGKTVSLSSDGNVVAFSGDRNEESGMIQKHVEVYQNLNGVWIQVGSRIVQEDYSSGFGRSISLSSEGSVIAIGAPWNDSNGYNSGSVLVYRNLNNTWTQVGSDIDGEAQSDFFGAQCSLSDDGNILVVGAHNNDGNGIDSGRVYVYKNISDVWTQIGVGIDGEAEGDISGYGVNLSSDGTTLAIGAPSNDTNGIGSGHVRVYDLSALLSIKENEISKNFEVYPNPVNNLLQVQLAPHLEFKNAVIYNYFGQLVLQSKTTTINVNTLDSGVYYLEVETNKGKGVKKIIKE